MADDGSDLHPVTVAGTRPSTHYMAAEQAPGGWRYLTGNTCPGWEITRFVSSARIFPTAEAAEEAAKPWNALGHSFEVVPAQVLA